MNSSKLITRFIARTTPTKNTYSLKSWRLCELRRRVNLCLVIIFHKRKLDFSAFNSFLSDCKSVSIKGKERIKEEQKEFKFMWKTRCFVKRNLKSASFLWIGSRGSNRQRENIVIFEKRCYATRSYYWSFFISIKPIHFPPITFDHSIYPCFGTWIFFIKLQKVKDDSYRQTSV